MLIEEASKKDFKECDSAAIAYFISLAKAEALQKKVKEALVKTNNVPSVLLILKKLLIQS